MRCNRLVTQSMTLMPPKLQLPPCSYFFQTADKPMNIRLAVICLAAAAVGLSMAIVSVSKLLLFLAGLVSLLTPRQNGPGHSLGLLKSTPVVVMGALTAMTVSLMWTTAPDTDAFGSLAKYGKLLSILLLFLLIKTRRDALYAVAAFFAAQCFLVTSSWLLFAGVALPWATSNMAMTEYAVFSSYLDQGIISALFAALCWHLRALMPGRHGKLLAVLLTVLTLFNVFFVLRGRTGHVVAIALISLAVMWELPNRYRLAAILTPFVLLFALVTGSSKFRDRLTLVSTEIQLYSSQQVTTTSSGIRLGLWSSSIQLIENQPLIGSGVGSWSTEYNRLQRQKNPLHEDVRGNFNPHNEYLLWGVQLGIIGILTFVALLGAMMADAKGMGKNEARAVWSAVVALAVACLFNSSLYDAFIGDFFCIVIGLLLALGSHPTALTTSDKVIPKATL
jgi:O-antigen ligase